MKRFSAITALLLAFPFAVPARADLIPFQYQWSSAPTKVYADNPAAGHVEFIDGPLHTAGGDTNLVPANLHAVSSAPDSSPATFTNKPFTLTLTISEPSAPGSASMTFTGLLNGPLSSGTSRVTPTLTGLTTQSRVLNQHRYTVEMTTVVPPGDPGSGPSGAIGAYATVRVEAIVQELPEPASLALAGLAAAAVAASRVRRKRA